MKNKEMITKARNQNILNVNMTNHRQQYHV